MLISVLIPTICERSEKFKKLQDGLYTQIKDNKLENKIEILSIVDNRTIPLSQKRNTLQKLATGKYFTHLDDDDELSSDYCKTMVDYIEKNVMSTALHTKFEILNKYVHPIGYKVMKWKDDKKTSGDKKYILQKIM